MREGGGSKGISILFSSEEWSGAQDKLRSRPCLNMYLISTLVKRFEWKLFLCHLFGN